MLTGYLLRLILCLIMTDARNFRRTLATLCLCLRLAYSQTEDAGENVFTLPEVRVTSQKIPRYLQETQESIALMDNTFIRELDIQNLPDLYIQAANVHTIVDEGFGIRGITQNSIATGGGDGPLASYYIDGVSLTGFTTRFGPNDLWDVEQVEILRGPQSTNVGRSALAGAVTVKTADPTPTNFLTALEVSYAEYNTSNIAGMFNAPLTERSAVRLAVEHQRSDGFISNPTRSEDDYDDRDNTTARIKWLWEPSALEGLRSVASFQYSKTSRGENIVSLVDPAARENFANLEAFEDAETFLLAWDVQYDLTENWKLFSLFSLLSSEYDRQDDDDQGPGGEDAFRGRFAEDDNWAQEMRLNYGSADNSLRGTVGFYFTDIGLSNTTDGLVNLQPALLGVPDSLLPFYPASIGVGRDSQFDTDTRNYAFFTEWEKDMWELWTFNVGFRYDREHQVDAGTSATTLLDALPDPTAPGLPAAVAAGIAQVNGLLLSQLNNSATASETTFDAFLPKGSITYRWTENVSTAFHIKRGYRTGGSGVNQLGEFFEYEPEFLTNYELSFRSNWFDSRVIANVNAYFGQWKNQQVSIQQSASAFDLITVNAGESEIAGFEFEVRASVTDDLNLYSSLGYAHTEFTEFINNGVDQSGNRFSLAPEWTYSVGGTYRFLDGFFYHANMTYQSGAPSDIPNTEALYIDSRTIVNMRIGYQYENYRIQLFADNLFNELYLNNRFFNLSSPGNTEVLGVVGDPRLIGVRINADF